MFCLRSNNLTLSRQHYSLWRRRRYRPLLFLSLQLESDECISSLLPGDVGIQCEQGQSDLVELSPQRDHHIDECLSDLLTYRL